MSEGRYRALRELPFDQVARALGIDFSKFKQRKGGAEWAGPCPVHQAKKNGTAFSYSADGKWHCFSCSAKGRGAIDLAMAIRGIGFQAAVELLEPYVGQPLTSVKVQTPQVDEGLPTENPAKQFTYEQHFQPSEWLTARGISSETCLHYGVGLYDNPARKSAYKGKILLRIQRWSDGGVVGYLARDIRPEEDRGDSPKYVFPSGVHKSLELWGAWQLKDRAPVRVLYVVESPFAVMHFHQLGLPAVALMGWSVSNQQLDILAQLAKGIVYLPDADKRTEAMQYVGLIATRLWCRYPVMPAEDPEQLTLEQIRSLT